MPNKIEVAMKPGMPDPAGQGVACRLAEDLGIKVDNVRVIDVYTIDAELSPEEIERVRTELFTDPIIQVSVTNASLATDYDFVIEVGFLPGVTDNVGKSSAEGIADTLGRALKPGEAVYKSAQYVIRGKVDRTTCERIARDALANELIQRWTVKSVDEMKSLGHTSLLGLPIVTDRSDPTVHTISLDISDDELVALSREKTFALELHEMKAIQAHFRDAKVREERAKVGLPESPTDIELEILAQTWSEHCKHKIFNAEIEYTGPDGQTRVIDSVFKTYVKATTDEAAKNVDWLVSVFHDNAGIIKFDDEWNFALKAETHNSPSALDPYGGAITGIVGVNRDILGAGMGCRCILNTDVFCFASPFYDGEIPPRLFHPRRVLRGVHQGVKDGGNQSGIPDVNGAIVFHERFLGKPLVFCGTGGMIPAKVMGKPSEEKKANPGDLIVMTGGRIGKDGIHGATFSSEELHEGSPATAVQIGDPITQKKMADFIIEARDLGLFTDIQDDGAGGLSSSVGEMARGSGGCEVYLDKAPLKYAGLAPWEIFVSEAQERMTLAVPPDKVDQFLSLAKRRAVEATVLGVFTDSGRLECYYDGKLIAGLDMDFLHDGVPKMHLKAKWDPPERNWRKYIEKSSRDMVAVFDEVDNNSFEESLGDANNGTGIAAKELYAAFLRERAANRDPWRRLADLLGRQSEKSSRVSPISFDDLDIPRHTLEQLDADIAQLYRVVPVVEAGKTLIVAATKMSFKLVENLEKLLDRPIEVLSASPRELERALNKYYAGRKPTPVATSFNKTLKSVLGALNVCSKESFVRMYDHEVLAQSVLKQFQGKDHDGPGDAAVIRPVPGSKRGIAIACGICPKYSDLDTYDMAACAIDETVRNLIAVGAKLGTIAGLDNSCWPDPIQSDKTPDGAHKLAQLVRCCEALYDVCTAYGIPLISGKDSMKNDYKIGDTKISIPPTLLFTGAAILEDATKVVSMDVKTAGDVVYIVGETKDEMGGSEFLQLLGILGTDAPKVNPARARQTYLKLSDAMARGLVASCHDCSDGGLVVALAESAFAGGYGMDLDISGIDVPSDVVALFSESQSRFVVTVHPENSDAFVAAMSDCPVMPLGTVTDETNFIVASRNGVIINAPIAELKEAWQEPLRW